MRSTLTVLAALLVACGTDRKDSPAVVDVDNDGYSADVDCDDENAAIHPGAAETWYDGVDSDCDEADDFDQDGDGVRGDVGGLDCDDTAPNIYAGNRETCDGIDNDCDGETDEEAIDAVAIFLDTDGDGWGTGAAGAPTCEVPQGWATVDGDCDDADANRSPDAQEVCNEIDDDCDGYIDRDAADATEWHADIDGDGFGDGASLARACTQPMGWTLDDGDCDDADPASFPGGAELCDNRDNDCDGTTDEDAGDARVWYPDADADGFGTSGVTIASCTEPAGHAGTDTDCDDTDATVNPGVPETCDGTDNDCSGAADDDAVDATAYHPDTDGDGFGDAETALLACTPISGWRTDGSDCDDTDPASHPGAAEICGGGDENCDGSVDESGARGEREFYIDGDRDGYGSLAALTTACDAPRGYVANADDCDDSVGATSPGARERCDGIDNDCDGASDEADAYDIDTWYRDSDGDGYGGTVGSIVRCDAPAGYVADGTDCDDADATISPDGVETRDLIDQDCDDMVDEDFIVTGDIVVTELARQPYVGGTGLSAYVNGQWFEVMNVSSDTIDLSGWYIEEGDGDFYYVSPDAALVLAPGEIGVLCYGTAGFATASTCDYAWGNVANGVSSLGLAQYDTTFYFDRDEDLLALYVDGVLVDDLSWSLASVGGATWPRTARYSMRLDDDALDASSNDYPAAWCLAASSQIYTATGARAGPDYGTPGAANGSCD